MSSELPIATRHSPVLGCPRCGAEMEVNAVHVSETELGVSFMCLPCDTVAIQPASNTLPVSRFLAMTTEILGW